MARGTRSAPPGPRFSRATLGEQVMRALLNARDRGRFSTHDAADVARVTLTRGERAGAVLSDEKRAQLVLAIGALAAHLDVTDAQSLEAFSFACADACLALVPKDRHPGQRISEKTGNLRALAEAAVYAERMNSSTDEQLVQRAVTRAVRERRRGRPGMAPVRLVDDDPLRGLLELPARGNVVLQRTDVRARVAAAADKNATLASVLRQAARFDPSTLRRALGESLWALGQVVGFTDKKETRVLVRVTSSTLGEEVQLRSVEYLARLRTVHGFEQVTDLRLQVKAPPRTPR